MIDVELEQGQDGRSNPASAELVAGEHGAIDNGDAEPTAMQRARRGRTCGPSANHEGIEVLHGFHVDNNTDGVVLARRAGNGGGNPS
jgi:hypothetical protein